MKPENGNVSFIHCGFSGLRYFIGYKNGNIEAYDNSKMEADQDLNSKLKNIGSKVTSIVTSRKYICYSSVNGRVLVVFFNSGECVELQKECKGEINDLKISVSKHFLYGMYDRSPNELMMVWNVMTGKLVHEHDLDIEDKPEDKEDTYKLMIDHTDDASLMFIRSCFRKGVSILSFDDGV